MTDHNMRIVGAVVLAILGMIYWGDGGGWLIFLAYAILPDGVLS